jgi:glycosyl hydrolase family 99
MTARPTRRQLLQAGLAAGAGAALARYAPWGEAPLSAAAQAAERRALGFPVAAAGWHGDSSIGAAIRSGVIPANSPLDTVVRSLHPPIASDRVPGAEGDARREPREPRPANPATAIPPNTSERLRSRFRDLRRHFVFEYYPWYQANPYGHWNGGGHRPPFDISSTMMPALGPYDSSDAKAIAQHARWMADSGVGAIAISWWGPHSYEDNNVPLIMDVMRAHDIHVTFHIEPYRDDRVQFYAEDIRYILREYGERRHWDAFLLLEHADGSATPVFKSFRSILPETVVDCKGRVQRVPDFTTNAAWRRQTDTIREQVRPSFDRIVLLADSLNLASTIAAGFDGIAIYDSFVRPSAWPSVASSCASSRLLFSFAVNCGFDASLSLGPPGECDVPLPFEPPVGPIDWTSADSREKAKSASFDRVLDSMKTTIALQVGPASFNDARGFFLTYVNTFNEWHEGTSFEPARNLADLLPEERPFNYHNPPDGAWRLQLLQSLLRPVISGG